MTEEPERGERATATILAWPAALPSRSRLCYVAMSYVEVRVMPAPPLRAFARHTAREKKAAVVVIRARWSAVAAIVFRAPGVA